MIHFPSLRWKIQAFKDDMRQNMTTPWNNGGTVQFSSPPKPPQKLKEMHPRQDKDQMVQQKS